MRFSELPTDAQVAGMFFLTLVPTMIAMKIVAFRGAPESKVRAFALAPFPSPASARRALPWSAGPRLIRRFLVALCACVVGYWLYWQFVTGLPRVVWSYAGAILLWLVSEALGSLAPFLAAPSGRLLPLPHGGSPPLANSLSDFWGRRWNVWTSDWFRQMIFHPLRHRSVLALILVFLVSGLLHEWVINFSLYVVTGTNYFGSMMIYFLLQAVGILLERSVRNRRVRVLFVWLFVLGPAPLFVNEGMLRIVGLWSD